MCDARGPDNYIRVQELSPVSGDLKQRFAGRGMGKGECAPERNILAAGRFDFEDDLTSSSDDEDVSLSPTEVEETDEEDEEDEDAEDYSEDDEDENDSEAQDDGDELEDEDDEGWDSDEDSQVSAESY